MLSLACFAPLTPPAPINSHRPSPYYRPHSLSISRPHSLSNSRPHSLSTPSQRHRSPHTDVGVGLYAVFYHLLGARRGGPRELELAEPPTEGCSATAGLLAKAKAAQTKTARPEVANALWVKAPTDRAQPLRVAMRASVDYANLKYSLVCACLEAGRLLSPPRSIGRHLSPPRSIGRHLLWHLCTLSHSVDYRRWL